MRVGSRLAFVRASILSAFRKIWKWQTILPRQLLLSPLRLRFRKTDRIVDCSILPVNPSAVETVPARPSTRPPSSMTTATSRWFCVNRTGKVTPVLVSGRLSVATSRFANSGSLTVAAFANACIRNEYIGDIQPNVRHAPRAAGVSPPWSVTGRASRTKRIMFGERRPPQSSDPAAASVSPPWFWATPHRATLELLAERGCSRTTMHERSFTRAAGVSPPWFGNRTCNGDRFSRSDYVSTHARMVHHGWLTPAAPGARRRSLKNNDIRGAQTHVHKSGGRQPAVGVRSNCHRGDVSKASPNFTSG
jgi:hypothetical protein